MATTTNTSPFKFSLALQAMSHMITMKLSSSNYLLWHSLIHHLFFSQEFLSYIDGSSPLPAKMIVDAVGSTSPNPGYTKWYANDQIVKVFLTSTLSEEALATVTGCSSSRDVCDTFVLFPLDFLMQSYRSFCTLLTFSFICKFGLSFFFSLASIDFCSC